MVAAYIYAGIRREAALWLTMEDVDFDRRLIRVRAKTIAGEFWQPKTKRNRVVPISKALLEILKAYKADKLREQLKDTIIMLEMIRGRLAPVTGAAGDGALLRLRHTSTPR